ncbi:MAG: histidine triad nucleotide-binding protein [bacterium]
MGKCILCNIVNKNVPANIVYEDDHVIALRDINPQAPVHLLIVPKKHVATIMDLTSQDKDLIGQIYLVAQKLASQESIAQCGFRIVANCNADAGQAVFHIHFHLLGGRKLTWPPG